MPVAINNVATDNQKHAKYVKDSEEQSQEVQFNSPIVVNEQQKLLLENVNEPVIVQQKEGPVVFTEKYLPVKQINLKILTSSRGSGVEEQYLREVTPKTVNGHTNSNNAHYLVEDVQGLEVTPPTRSEAPSRQFLKNFKTFRNYDQSTVAVSYSTTTSRTAAKNTDRGCCQNHESVVTSTTPISTNFLAPVHAGIRLTNEKLDDCVDGHTVNPVIVEVKKSVNIKNYLVQEKPLNVPAYGDKIFVSTTPAVPISTQAIYFKEEVHVPVEKTVFVQSTPRIVERPVYIKTPPETKILHQQVFVEKPVIKEVKVPVPVEKTVFIKTKPQIVDRPVYIKSPPEIKVVQQQVFVEKPVIKEVQVPVEKTVYIKSKPEIVDRPVYIKSPPETRIVEKQVFVEKPVIKEVQVPFEKTVYIKSKPEIIDRPVYIQSPPQTKIVKEQVFIEKPVIKEVQVPVEKTVYIKSKPEIIDRPVYIQSPPETKIVEKQVFIDRPVIKEVQVPVEKTVYINSPPQTIEKPVYIEKIVDRPVEKIVEKIIDRPYPVEKYIDRPYPVPYAVHVPYEKHILTKPDFHVYAKSSQHKGKLFDFDGLFGFLGKRKEIKHIFVPSSQQHQLKQLNHHQLIQSSLTTIDAVNEAPVLDYTKFATSHLNPIKPVYGVPSTPLEPVSGGYNYQNPYAGEKFMTSLKKYFENFCQYSEICLTENHFCKIKISFL